MHSRFLKYWLAGLVWGAPLMPTAVADSSSRGGPQAESASLLDTLLRRSFGNERCPEIMEMIAALASGSSMGPGSGWFHPGQNRYSWDWLAVRFDADKNGRITRKEFQGPAELFDRLDRDGDGVLTKEDFDWSDRSPFVRQVAATGQWFRCMDANSNGRISHEEWEAFFARAAKGKDHVTREDLRAALNPPVPPEESGANDPSILALILGLLSGELGSMREGPALDQQAPDFTLPTQNGNRPVHLSDFRGKKPVVLVFGSFT